MSIPSLETERLILRPHRADDLADCAAMWADPIVVRYISGRPATVEETWGGMLKYAGHWALMGWGYWAIVEKASGAFAGDLGFEDLKREIDPPLTGTPELGWALAPRFHGKGYATEAARAAIAWADSFFGNRETACIIHPDNRPSIRVAEKLAYHEVARTTYKGQPTIVFKRNVQ